MDKVLIAMSGGVDSSVAAFLMKEQGCECILLACTEMSTYKDWHHLDDFYVDAMDVLACRCIQVCGYPLRDV